MSRQWGRSKSQKVIVITGAPGLVDIQNLHEPSINIHNYQLFWCDKIPMLQCAGFRGWIQCGFNEQIPSAQLHDFGFHMSMWIARPEIKK